MKQARKPYLKGIEGDMIVLDIFSFGQEVSNGLRLFSLQRKEEVLAARTYQDLHFLPAIEKLPAELVLTQEFQQPFDFETFLHELLLHQQLELASCLFLLGPAVPYQKRVVEVHVGDLQARHPGLKAVFFLALILSDHL